MVLIANVSTVNDDETTTDSATPGAFAGIEEDGPHPPAGVGTYAAIAEHAAALTRLPPRAEARLQRSVLPGFLAMRGRPPIIAGKEVAPANHGPSGIQRLSALSFAPWVTPNRLFISWQILP